MARKKGDGRGRLGGRAPGVPNKVKHDTKQIIMAIVEKNAEKAEQMLDMVVDPKDWVTLWIKLNEFVTPKMAAVSVSTEKSACDLKSELEEMAEEEDDR